jgi:antirestriction protein
MNRSTTEICTPRIYVASLADYNAGNLHGCWIDADQPADAIREQIKQMLAESEEPIAEEWAIHDYEGFGSYSLSEWTDIDTVAEIASLIGEHGELFAELIAHFGDLQDAKRWMADGYRGEWNSLTEYAEQLIDDCYSDTLKGLPDFIRYHIDFEGIGRDMELSGDIFTIELNHKVHVFDSCI